MAYSFGNRSKVKLASCHKDLQIIAEEAIKVSMVDFGISEGHRTLEKQLEYFSTGKSKIDGIKKKGKHNQSPANAFDFYAYIPNKPELSFDIRYLCYLVGVITATAQRLLNEGRITHKVRSGANWDSDGELLTDQDFDDLPHVEIV